MEIKRIKASCLAGGRNHSRAVLLETMHLTVVVVPRALSLASTDSHLHARGRRRKVGRIFSSIVKVEGVVQRHHQRPLDHSHAQIQNPCVFCLINMGMEIRESAKLAQNLIFKQSGINILRVSHKIPRFSFFNI